MHSSIPSSRPRRRWLRWVLGVFAASLLVLTIGLAQAVMLDADAATLRNALARTGGWTLKRHGQMTVGEGTLALAKFALDRCAGMDPMAGKALAAVRSASVGIYAVSAERVDAADARWTEVDAAMERRGWVRAVGVAQRGDNVVIYVQDAGRGSATMKVCLAVRAEKRFVVASAEIATEQLAEIASERFAEWPIHRVSVGARGGFGSWVR
ncbi:hypothetical protein K0B96_09970 [Horticoccus luteus]|uniref:Uncharacterized protein n=1 Tax=Horticoccus luteus TaxID=2862869 RepID=A0A8F9TT75_9BACT|nr:hypothetical protein [Horticoccus luteus]QYM77652.1 hypothetical protein K0B96_09970 [Horticoccus luteus]